MSRISKDEYGLIMAYCASLRSEDPFTQVGACVMNVEGRIIATGFNGLPAGVTYDPAWTREEKNKYMIHAEVNALSLIKKNEGHSLYLTISPCSSCSAMIAGYGIKRVIFGEEYHRCQEYKKILRKFNVEFGCLDVSLVTRYLTPACLSRQNIP